MAAKGSEVRLIIVDDPLEMPFVGDLIPPVPEGLSKEERARAKGGARQMRGTFAARKVQSHDAAARR